eukprot:438699-Hanusia_phi.AAC.1
MIVSILAALFKLVRRCQPGSTRDPGPRSKFNPIIRTHRVRRGPAAEILFMIKSGAERISKPRSPSLLSLIHI